MWKNYTHFGLNQPLQFLELGRLEGGRGQVEFGLSPAGGGKPCIHQQIAQSTRSAPGTGLGAKDATLNNTD